MSHFPDLSPYSYGRLNQPGVFHIGWLDAEHDFPKGSVPKEQTESLKKLARSPVERYRGYHICNLCTVPEELRNEIFPVRWEKWEKERSSNGEIRITYKGKTYAAPVLIPHYIEDHGYQPPSEFLEALEKSTEPGAPIR